MNLAVAVLFITCQKITETQLPQDAIETCQLLRGPSRRLETILI